MATNAKKPKLTVTECSDTEAPIIGKDNETKYDAFMIKLAIRSSYDKICEHYNSGCNTTLYSEEIITLKKLEHLRQQEKEYGKTAMAEVLLDYIIKEASNKQVRNFLDVIKQKQDDLYEIIEEVLLGNGSTKSFLQEIKEQLKKAYDEKKYHCIEALPGEKITLNLKKKRFLMPLVFHTKVRKTDKQSEYMSEKIYKYEDSDNSSIEEILGSLLKSPSEENEDIARVVLITAEAGCGKTVSIHRMVCQWMDENDPHLAQYDIVIAIPLRNVDTDESLTTILSDAKPKSTKHKGGLHYIKGKDMIQALDEYLREKKGLHKKVLFLLDGLDEVEIEKGSDLFNLITGDSFPLVNLVITTRPEGKLLTTLEKFYPDYKISITGTNKEGVHGYLKEMMTKEDGPSEDDITNLLKKCEEQMVSFDLLSVPLYLTLVGVMFNDHWAKHANFTDFHVPATMTDLFNSFFRILLIRWIERDSHYSHIKQVTFGRNPYDQTNVPKDILNKLHSFANMSYVFLKNQKYTFASDDLDKYLIEYKDVIDSGLFCHSSNVFFYKHLLLQEFMAALYLIHPMCTETFKSPAVQDSFDNSINDSDTFLGLQNIPVFVFGMSPQHAMDIIHKLRSKLQLKIYKPSGAKKFRSLNGIDVRFPLKLCNECNDNTVNNAFISLLSESQVCFTEEKLPGPDMNEIVHSFFTAESYAEPKLPGPEMSLYKTFFSSLTTDQAVSFLLSWYNIHMYRIEEGWAVEPVMNGDNSNSPVNDIIYDNSDRSLRIKYLDTTLMLLLQRFTLPQVHSLFVDRSWPNVPDMITIEKMFPNITKLFVSVYLFGFNDTLNIPGCTTHQLRSLQHISHPWMKYSPQSQQLLLQQSQLETLYVNDSLMHDISNIQQQQPYWPKLHTLLLSMWGCKLDEQWHRDLCHVLKGVPQLHVLSLNGSNPSVRTTTSLLQCIREHLTHLNKLHLCYMLDSQTLPMLFPVIGNMNQLKNLGLGYSDIGKNIDSLVDGLSTVNNIKQLEILYDETEESDTQTTMNNTIQYMNSHYPEMSIEVSCTESHDYHVKSEFLAFLKIFFYIDK